MTAERLTNISITRQKTNMIPIKHTMKRRFITVGTLMLLGAAGLTFTGCFADKALLGIDTDQSREINRKLTAPIRLEKPVPGNLSDMDKNAILITRTVIGTTKDYQPPRYNTAELTRRANYYCQSAHQKFQKVYRYRFEFAPDNQTVNIINTSYCPICYSSGELHPLQKKGNEHLCPFDQKTGKQIIEDLTEIRNYIAKDYYHDLVRFSKFKNQIKDRYRIYDAFMYYLNLDGNNDEKKIELTRQFIETMKSADESLSQAQSALNQWDRKHTESRSGGIQINCTDSGNTLSMSEVRQKEAAGRGTGSGIALGYSMEHGTQTLSDREIEKICKQELNLQNLDCVTYDSALQSCKTKLRTVSMPR